MLQSIQLKSSFDVHDHSLAIEYYSNILYNVGPYSALPIHKLIGYRGQAPPEVQRVAVSAVDLKKFLTRYPSIFTVSEDCVKLVSTIVDNRIPREKVNFKATSSNDCDVAVQYYVDVMKKKMSTSNDTSVPLKNLIGYRSQAPTVVQNCAKNINELSSFLSSHPETFTVLPGKFVALTKSPSAISDKNEKPNQAPKPKYNENDSSLAVKYYSDILNTSGPNYSIHSLIGHRGQAPLEVKKVAHNFNDLKLFLSRFPNIFSINGEVVTLRKVTPALHSNSGKCDVKSGSYPKKYDPDAVQFYANILREKGCYGKEYPIQKLTGYRSQAPLEVQNAAKNTSELYELFSNYPNLFTITPKKGVILIESPLNNIVSKVQNLSLTLNEKCNSAKAIEYYSNILRRWIPNSEFPIAELMVYLNRAPLDVHREARNEVELTKFFLKHPDKFIVIQNKFVKLIDTSANSINIVQNSTAKPIECVRNLNVDNRVRTLRYFPPLEYPENLGFSGTWEDHVLENTVLVTEKEECLEACEVIKKEKIIGFDCEGFNLGRGIISLIQVALINGTVYIFDIYGLPSMISCGLKEIIESDEILKVINYCRNDCLNLKGQYDVNLKYIFDVSVAYHVIECKKMSLSNFKPAGFNQICAKYGVPTNTCKDDLKYIYITQPDYWLNRPLNMKMVSYAAFDVASLVPYLYCEFLKRMDQETESAVWRLSQRMCIT